jgi:thiamine-monophosphate kinase
LLADLRHVCEVSKLVAVVEASRVPLSAAARACLATSPEHLTTVLTGGDDYEILFTAPATALNGLAELSQVLHVPITAIGRMELPPIAEGAQITVLDESRKPLSFDRAGWTHF